MLRYFNLWVAFTFVLFYFGPIEQDGRGSIGAFVVVAFNMLFFNLGVFCGDRMTLRPTKSVSIFGRQQIPTFVVLVICGSAAAIVIHRSAGLWMFDPAGYSSANMQLAISFDWLFATLILFTVQTVRIFRGSSPLATA